MTDLTNHIHAAWPRHTAKSIERALGCEPRLAARIASTGKAPISLRTVLLHAIDTAIRTNRSELDRLHEDLREKLAPKSVVDPHADHHAQDVGVFPGMAAPAAGVGNR